ncbi:hypothetical protein [Photobacterium damselae]|uniref:hypothetical protein n=1 Tax=Photobacterium damselae TaxID=38293 RepID=UPI001F3909DF|nr:hypothetical protein [Photobacterium damselae]UKA04948.1 hypothetical protein IHC89_22140 [Photobacterium damselae subsp. damselae]
MSKETNKDIAKFNALSIAQIAISSIDIENELGELLEQEDLSEFTELIQKEMQSLSRALANRADRLNAKYSRKIPNFAKISLETVPIKNPCDPLS